MVGQILNPTDDYICCNAMINQPSSCVVYSINTRYPNNRRKIKYKIEPKHYFQSLLMSFKIRNLADTIKNIRPYKLKYISICTKIVQLVQTYKSAKCDQVDHSPIYWQVKIYMNQRDSRYIALSTQFSKVTVKMNTAIVFISKN